jgi:hypothetical protein
MTASNHEHVPDTVGLVLRFDVTTDPADLAALQESLVTTARALGGNAVTATVDVPETYPPNVADEKLTMPLGLFLAERRRNSMSKEVGTQLRLEGLRDARDLLAIGTEKIRSLSRAGDMTIAHVENNLAAPPFPIRIRRRPSIQQVVGLCGTLDQVVVQAATHPLGHRLLGREEKDNRLTIQDVIDETEKFQQLIGDNEKMRSDIQNFADAFTAAKEGLR